MTNWFDNPRWLEAPKHIVSASVAATDEAGRLLLVKTPWRGWEIPGGQVEQMESIEAAAIREVKEESGIDVAGLAFRGIFQSQDRCIVNLLFRGRCIGGTIATSEESLDVGFFELPHALDLITHSNFRQRVELCLDENERAFVVTLGS